MSARRAALPYEHVLAEMTAFPLATEAAFSSALTSLDHRMQDGTRRLWRDAESTLAAALPAFSLDELALMRDRIWFPAGPMNIPLHAYLRRVARAHLRTVGDAATPSREQVGVHSNTFFGSDGRSDALEACHARWQWRWMSYALPPDLLAAALPRVPMSITTLAPPLARLLEDRGFAEVHLHLGAGLSFAQLWSLMQWLIAHPALGRKAFCSPGAPFQEGRALGPYVLRAAIGRVVLALFLSRAHRGPASFDEFLQQTSERGVATAGSGFVATLLSNLGALRRPPLGTPESIGEGRIPYAQAVTLYRMLSSFKGSRKPITLRDVWACDPVAKLLPASDSSEFGAEAVFVHAGLAHLEHNPGDCLFAELFWQCIRVRCLLYRHLVQRPMTPGLQWFVRFYGRLDEVTSVVSTRVFVDGARSLCGENRGLRSLEVRFAPKPDRSSLLQKVIEVEDSVRAAAEGAREGSSSPPEIGVVLHLPRDRGGGMLQGRAGAYGVGSHGDPRSTLNSASGLRFSHVYRMQRERATSFSSVLRTYPLSLRLLRGIDVCTDELGIPLWVFAPLFRHVRRAGQAASTFLSSQLGIPTPPLHTTAHAGEDCVHLLDGLRRIDEAVVRLDLREGDRLGHAIALGTAPTRWCEASGRVPLTKETRLLDLIWEWSCYSARGIRAPVSRIAVVEHEAEGLACDVFGWAKPRHDMRHLELLVELLHNPLALVAVGFPDARREPWPGRSSSDEMAPLRSLSRWLSDPGVFARGQEVVWVDPWRDLEAMEIIQQELRRALAARGIAVEINPSSNLLIGNLCDLTDHPLWRLSTIAGTAGTSTDLTLCVGSDDPLTFATTVRDEYALVEDALRRGGKSSEAAGACVETLLAASMNRRFTLRHTQDEPAIRSVTWGGAPMDIVVP